MSNLFKRKPTNKVRTAYNYRPNASLRAQEKSVSRRFVLTFALIIIIASALYFWGIEIVIGLSGFWRTVLPNSQIFEPSGSSVESTEELIFAPRIDPLPLYVNASKIDIKGWSQSGVEVRIYLNSSKIAQLLTDKNGRFEFSGAELTEGENNIYAVADINSVESEPSDIQKINLDTQNPLLEVALLKDAVTDDGKLKVTGHSEPGTTVFINDQRVIITTDGDFEYDFNLQDGSNEVRVKAIDLAGNETQFVDRLEYDKPEEKPADEQNSEQGNN